MSQLGIIDLLRREPDKWFKTKDIKIMTNLSIGTIASNMKKLRKQELVNFKNHREDNVRTMIIYNYKKKITFGD